MKRRLVDIAYARSGDKGDTANVGLAAKDPKHYAVLVREVTPERVALHFKGMLTGGVGNLLGYLGVGWWFAANARWVSAESRDTPKTTTPAAVYLANASRNAHASFVHPGDSSFG